GADTGRTAATATGRAVRAGPRCLAHSRRTACRNATRRTHGGRRRMKLTRIRLEQVRKFRGAIEIDGLEPGLNLIVGPNESGKGTLASAIGSAFFERYRSVAAESLRPLGDNSAAPAISIDFDVGGTGYRLSKRYLSRPRCELAAGDQRYEGSEAEDRLAAL